MKILFFMLALFSSSVFSAGYSVTTVPVTNITKTSATLNGQLAKSDSIYATNLFFYFGTTTPPTIQVAATPNFIGAADPNGPYSFTYNATSLTCNTTYYYKAYVSNTRPAQGEGSIESFTTSPCASPTPQPSSPIPTLSEWAQIVMMLAMIATAGFYGWRMKQH